MSRHEVAFTAAAAIGLFCSVVAAICVWLVLTDPVAVTSLVSQQGIVALFATLVDAARHAALALFQAL